MTLRDCFSLQRPPIYGCVNFYPFGRALLQTGKRDMPEAMLYWVRLPIFQHRYVMQWLEDRMCQAVLCWHGHEGFRVLWIDMGKP